MAKTKLVGILNITPDSFSDGGINMDASAALSAAKKMMEEGAFIIDIGAESTRPGATPLSHEEEWERLATLLPQLGGIRWGIDTRHAQTARKALEYGSYWINDVLGFSDPAMVQVVLQSQCKLVVMHSLGVPADKNAVMAKDCDVVKEVTQWAHTRLGYMAQQGIAKERMIFDPGIGFGKTAGQSWEILRNAEKFKALGAPLFVGHSRKSFLGGGDRDTATLGASLELIKKGVDYLRVHDVASHQKLLLEIVADA